MTEKAMFEKGLKIRKSVLGEDYVNEALAKVDDFTRPLQEIVTGYCWGEIWGRDALPKKTRSMINLAMLTALNRPNELKIHVAGALRNGCTEQEMQEVLLQAMIYCGVPAGVESFRIANEVIKGGRQTGRK